MKNVFYCLLGTFLMVACTSTPENNDQESVVDTETTVKELDALNENLEQTKSKINTATEDLDAALEELDN